jgi:hypothetical protein
MADDATTEQANIPSRDAMHSEDAHLKGTSLGDALLKLSQKEREDLNYELCQLLAKHAGRSIISIVENEHYTKGFYICALVVGQCKK